MLPIQEDSPSCLLDPGQHVLCLRRESVDRFEYERTGTSPEFLVVRV